MHHDRALQRFRRLRSRDLTRLLTPIVLLGLLAASCGGAATTTSTATTATTAAPTSTSTSAPPSSPTSTTGAETTTTAVLAGPTLDGDDAFVAHATAALTRLSEDAPDAYHAVLAHIDTVRSVGEGSGMDVFTRTFLVGEETAYAPGFGADDQVLWLAGTMVHDACHSRLYALGQSYTGRDAELECLQDQLEAMMWLGSEYFQTYLEGLIEGVDDPENAYWSDPDRHW